MLYFFDRSLGVNVYPLDRPNEYHFGVLLAVKNEIEVSYPVINVLAEFVKHVVIVILS